MIRARYAIRSHDSVARLKSSRWLVAVLVAAIAGALHGQQLPSYIEKRSDAAGVYAIYPGSGVPSGSEKWTWHEQSIQAPGSTVPNRMVRNVTIPAVTMFKPAQGTANGTAMIVAPGGAFTFLMVDYEGYDMARWLAQRGVTAFVLRYRVAHTPENDQEFFSFVQKLVSVLPDPDAKVETPPTGTREVEEARA